MATRVSQKSNKTELKVLRSARLNLLPWLVHGFSTRVGGTSRVYGAGDLNLGFTREDSRSSVERNRREFLQAIAAAGERNHAATNGNRRLWPIITLRQVHSDIIRRVEISDHALVGDGLITNQPHLLLAIQTADCLPIMLVDPKHRAVGIVHAGWRGTIKRIVEKGVGAMQLHFGSRAADLRAAIGPGIHNCCYEVGEEVREKFFSQFSYAADLFHEVKESDPVREKYPLLFLTARAPGHGKLPSKIFLDLVEANRRQLLSMGLAPKNIQASDLCTSCRTDLLFSYRAEKGKTGRLMAVAGIRG